MNCPNCGIDVGEGKKFCRNCGHPLPEPADTEATTWRLPPTTSPQEPNRQTSPVNPPPDQAGPTYIPPQTYYTPPQPPVPYAPQPPAAYAAYPGRNPIALGEWLSGGWAVYKENWLLMSVATLLGMFLGTVTLGILAGPMLMGLYRMAFKTMRYERPEMNDLFNWEGRFLQAFLAFLIYGAVYAGLSGAGNNSPIFVIFNILVSPILTVMLAFSMPLILDRNMDIAAAVNEVGRRVFSKDFLMWWVIGLVFSTIAGIGFLGFCFGLFVTLPWMICSAAYAYRSIYEDDDPNRTLH